MAEHRDRSEEDVAGEREKKNESRSQEGASEGDGAKEEELPEKIRRACEPRVQLRHRDSACDV